MYPSDEERNWHAEPTVPKDKWIAHARKKLARGYVLIVSQHQPNANFFKTGVGYEMCPYQTARKLVQTGIVTEVGPHHLGIVYQLPVDYDPSATAPPAA